MLSSNRVTYQNASYGNIFELLVKSSPDGIRNLIVHKLLIPQSNDILVRRYLKHRRCAFVGLQGLWEQDVVRSGHHL
jgi:hypothetical protein